MKRNGIVLYQEVDKFNETMGVLVSYCHPPNKQDIQTASRALRCALEALLAAKKKELEVRDKGEPGTEAQLRYNYSRTELRELAGDWKKKIRDEVKKKVWKG